MDLESSLEFESKGEQMDVHISVVLQQVHWIKPQEKTFAAWVEIGFRFDVREFLDHHGNFIDDANGIVRATDVLMTYNVVNAVKCEERSSAHFFREANQGGSLVPLYGDAHNLVKTIDIRSCEVGQFVKCESHTLDVELIYTSTEEFAPFDEAHLFLKVMTSDGRPGTESIRFVYDETETSFKGAEVPVGAFYPVDKKVLINHLTNVKVGSATWDRLYLSTRFRRYMLQDMIKYYLVPTLVFVFVVVQPFADTADLISVAATLVLANIALLFVASSHVLTYKEYAVLTQIICISAAAVTLSFEDAVVSVTSQAGIGNLQIGLLVTDILIELGMIIYQFARARASNNIALEAIKRNDFAVIDSL